MRITDKEFQQLADYIRKNYGIKLKNEKKTLVLSRLHKVLLERNFKNFTEYFEYILSDKTGDSAATLIDRITTNHTYFLREADHFRYFKTAVLPYLVSTVRERDLGIWSAGCSSGEEPYTLAMIIDEFLGKEKAQWDTRILATDISSRVLSKAKEGIYSEEGIASLPLHWKQNYFRRIDNEKYAIADRIRNEVIFRRLNLKDEVFRFRKKFHVIFCRNVMIYFDDETKNQLTDRFYDLTENGGYLFLGHSESLNRETAKYKYVMPAVYRKLQRENSVCVNRR